MKKMKLACAVLSSLIVSAAVGDTPATPTTAAAPAAEASIPFADHDGIYNWQVIDDRTVLIQGQNRKWYKASLMSRCFDLRFAERLGFESNPDGSFDKFSSITVRGQSCPLTSLVEAPPPPRKVKANRTAPPRRSRAAIPRPASRGPRSSAFCDIRGRADLPRRRIVSAVSL